jgi:hypothetical protein
MKTHKPTRTRPDKSKASWVPGQKGQGGEGQSKGYGGSAGDGTGPSGPQEDVGPEDRTSPSLPTRSQLERVLR